jgi:hypothetical protein
MRRNNLWCVNLAHGGTGGKLVLQNSNAKIGLGMAFLATLGTSPYQGLDPLPSLRTGSTPIARPVLTSLRT